MTTPAYRRRRKMIQPKLQLWLMLHFLGVGLLALTFQFILFVTALSRIAAKLPMESVRMLEESKPALGLVMVWSILFLMPVLFLVGRAATFRIAGPLYRFGVFLKAVEDGSAVEDCRIRKGDQLQDLCGQINRTTAPLREQNRERLEDAQGDGGASQAA